MQVAKKGHNGAVPHSFYVTGHPLPYAAVARGTPVLLAAVPRCVSNNQGQTCICVLGQIPTLNNFTESADVETTAMEGHLRAAFV